ncbi:MAG: nickel-dependent hydrogenase large subunit [Burkholderiales bacterium]|nr:nickel-dependent hydrogenase large subunit [Burkholderiales bacterium]
MTLAAGELAIDLTLRDGVVDAVQLASTRPQVADALLRGRPADEAVALLPRLFSICGRAHGLAAELAVEAARGAPSAAAAPAQSGSPDRPDRPDRSDRPDRLARLEAELAHELLWRTLLDWPRLLGEPADADALARVRTALASGERSALRTAIEQTVLAGPAAPWWEHEHVPAFEIWVAQARTVAARVLAAVQRDGARHGAPRAPVALLPAPPATADLASIDAALTRDAQFELRPELDGAPAETGTVARLQAHPLVAALTRAYGRSALTRLAARITELARIACGAPAGQPLFGALALDAQRGLGWVETARGLLVHVAHLQGDRVAQWRIVAPTEWNFHPRGALLQGLISAHAVGAADLAQRAQWLVQSLDPCVSYRVRVNGSELAHA